MDEHIDNAYVFPRNKKMKGNSISNILNHHIVIMNGWPNIFIIRFIIKMRIYVANNDTCRIIFAIAEKIKENKENPTSLG